jgi:CheY-like chemotaxis protein
MKGMDLDMGIIQSTPYMDFPLKAGPEMDICLCACRVLLIDDDAAVLDVTRSILERLGCLVTPVSNGPEALDLFGKGPELFDLVITDMAMPHMTGDVLARKMLEIRQDTPVVLYSGHCGGITAEQAREIGIREIMMKPVRMQDLSRLVQKVLPVC